MDGGPTGNGRPTPWVHQQLEPSIVTFRDLAELWLKHWAKPRLRSYAACEARLPLHILPRIGGLLIAQDDDALRRSLAEVAAERGSEAG
jgi:hypothetical protein